MSESTPESIFTRFFDLWNQNGPQEDITFQNVITTVPDDTDLFSLFEEALNRANKDEDENGEEAETGESVGETVGEIEGLGEKKKGKHAIEKVSPELRDLLGRCLVWNPKFRQTAEDILAHPFFHSLHTSTILKEKEGKKEWCVAPVLKCVRLPDLTKLNDPEYIKEKKEREAEQKKEAFTLAEVYHFWKLAGGSVEAEIEKHYVAKPAIQKLPFLVPLHKFSEFYVANSYKIRHQFGTADDDESAKVADPSTLYDDVTHSISLDGLRKRLASPINLQQFSSLTSIKLKEQSFDYQRHR